jgi:hypothetical protein
MWSENEHIDISFLLPDDFPLELKSIRNYQQLVNNTSFILNDRMKRIEILLQDDGLIEGVEDALRVARGKIIIITKNNLATFDRLIKVSFLCCFYLYFNKKSMFVGSPERQTRYSRLDRLLGVDCSRIGRRPKGM